ncbi:MAG: gamma-glutamylcyclotransferase [Puniceicoccaceae bacterium]
MSNGPIEETRLREPGELLFVYGTLKRGGQYHHLLQQDGTEFKGSGQLTTPYPLILAEYPCLLDQPGHGYRVKGELFRIGSTSTWEAVDRLEDHPREYLRRLEPVESGNHTVRAWTYFYRLPELLDSSLLPVEAFPL